MHLTNFWLKARASFLDDVLVSVTPESQLVDHNMCSGMETHTYNPEFIAKTSEI